MSEIIPSPNIWHTPDVYEIENLGVDRPQLIEAAMNRLHSWQGQDLVDIGCGTGFHLPRFAASARSVIGIEPHAPLAELARQRISQLPPTNGTSAASGQAPVRVVEATASDTGLRDASVDVAHARWSYFFGPGSEPGLDELSRIMRPGGTAFVIDNDATRSTFGRWFRRELPHYDPIAVERFWTRRGWQAERLDITWEFDSREDFEAVVAIEFAPEHADLILAERPEATGVDYAVNLWWHRF